MSKRKRAVDREPLRKCPKLMRRVAGNDPFIRLNDDIIVSHILSRLPLEETVRTSVLSRRWQKLWTDSIGAKLIFANLFDRYYHPSMMRDYKVNSLRLLLAHGISRILETLKPNLDELTICFSFESSSSHTIDSWVEYALRKRVTRLELDFTTYLHYLRKSNYTFPGIDKLSAWHAMCDDHLHQPINCAGLYNLRDVCLKSINVPVEVIECMLSNCPSLERLCVWNSRLKQKVRVCTQSSKLKSLEFVECDYTEIEISSPYLVSFGYHGDKGVLRLENAPLLSELSIGSRYCRSFLKGRALLRYISQLKRLTLDIDPEVIARSKAYSLEFPQLVRLELLELNLISDKNSSLLWPIILIKAAPVLHKVSIKLEALEGFIASSPDHVDFRRNLLNAIEQVHHQCLKLIEIRGFKGYPMEMELGQHLLGISQSLEQFVVRPGGREKSHPLNYVFSCADTYRERAQQFSRWLPATAKLVVL